MDLHLRTDQTPGLEHANTPQLMQQMQRVQEHTDQQHLSTVMAHSTHQVPQHSMHSSAYELHPNIPLHHMQPEPHTNPSPSPSHSPHRVNTPPRQHHQSHVPYPSAASRHTQAARHNRCAGRGAADSKPRLSKDQHDLLEKQFLQQPKPSTVTKQGFADQLGVHIDKINNWFQNRRAKVKQDAKKKASTYSVPFKPAEDAHGNPLHEHAYISSAFYQTHIVPAPQQLHTSFSSAYPEVECSPTASPPYGFLGPVPADPSMPLCNPQDPGAMSFYGPDNTHLHTQDFDFNALSEYGKQIIAATSRENAHGIFLPSNVLLCQTDFAAGMDEAGQPIIHHVPFHPAADSSFGTISTDVSRSQSFSQESFNESFSSDMPMPVMPYAASSFFEPINFEAASMDHTPGIQTSTIMMPPQADSPVDMSTSSPSCAVYDTSLPMSQVSSCHGTPASSMPTGVPPSAFINMATHQTFNGTPITPTHTFEPKGRPSTSQENSSVDSGSTVRPSYQQLEHQQTPHQLYPPTTGVATQEHQTPQHVELTRQMEAAWNAGRPTMSQRAELQIEQYLPSDPVDASGLPPSGVCPTPMEFKFLEPGT